MPRRSSSRRRGDENEEPQERSVAAHVRERQRRVAEREASRLARPEARPKAALAHADRKKSAVSSTPFGSVPRKMTDNAPEGWCGPFSVARQMIEEREEAKRREELQDAEATHPLDEAMEELAAVKKREAHPSISWKSSLLSASTKDTDDDEKNGSPKKKKRKKIPSMYATRKDRAQVGKLGIKSLYDLCIQFLVDNFDHVESLGGNYVDAATRKRVAHELVARNALNDEALQSLAEPGIESLELVDASGVTSSALVEILGKLLPTGLRHLSLDQAGRCFGPKAAQLLVDSAVPANMKLQALAIGGAYLLRDDDSANLVSGLETSLQSIEFKACPLLSVRLCKSLSDSTDLILRELSLEDLTFSDEAWSALITAATSSQFWKGSLQALKLRRMEGLTDDRVQSLLSTPTVLTALDLGLNEQLTDRTLSHMRAGPFALSELRLTGLKNMTASGLEAYFTPVEKMRPPPTLRLLDLGQCHYEAVTDEILKLVSQASTVSSAAGLASLNVQGASLVTDASLETLVTDCGQTLQELNISFCTKLTDQGLGYLVDNCGPQLKNLQLWGLAQITELFLDGHSRTNDPTLKVSGVWMKKNSVLSLR